MTTIVSSDTEGAADADGGSGDILVVDDNAANLLAMEAALGVLGGRIVSAQSGEEALRVLLEQDFALILLDVQMPSLDGFETARLIRQRGRTRHTPIIFVTAHGRDEHDVLAAYRLGAVDFLFKPVVAEILRGKVSVFVELQRRTAQVARQSELLREHERREHERTLNEVRRRWDEEALLRRMDEMEETDKRKDEFLAVLSHELRNPLSAIIVGCDLLTRKLARAPSADESVARTRDRIDRQAQYLRRLVDDLLDLTRINTGKIELKRSMTSIQTVVEQAVVTSRPAIDERGHLLTVEAPAEPIMVWADPVRLVQVIANLLNNAARYTPQDGSVLGSIVVRCSTKDNGERVRIEVVDNGCGLKADLLPRIFDSFVQGTSHGPGQGLGLGLTIVKRLMALHDGTVTASSPGEGRGSTFAIELPVGPRRAAAADAGTSDAAPTAAATDAPPTAAAAPLTIVLVEDNEDIRESMKDLLTGLGHSVQSADNGGAGAELILQVAPDVAFVDIGLPVLDGYQVASRVRSRVGRDRLRLVAMTGYGQNADRVRALDAGFDAHLVKPPDVNDVLDILSAETLPTKEPTKER